MNKTTIPYQYRGNCGDVLIELTTKLKKSFKSILLEILNFKFGHSQKV